ncbi:1-(5-phosphoribosyl)-5-[(5-phosphoribosylamino)methylideneamino]imidazole-4-carboxamide isomerase [Candidatus Omnitrophota bacterium]
MIIYPALDIKEGKVVRLTQGRFQEVTIYSDHPVETAIKWNEQGATTLHVVDLDGAASGVCQNINYIEQLVKNVFIPIQVGGGIRNQEAILSLFNIGVDRVVLGTKAVEDIEFIKSVVQQFGERIVVSIDSSRERVATEGWKNISTITPYELAQSLEKVGVKTIVFTDIARDGMLSGPNFASIEKMLDSIKIPLIVSGGVSSIEDIKRLKEIEGKGIKGVIIGKALYESNINLKEAIELCSPGV